MDREVRNLVSPYARDTGFTQLNMYKKMEKIAMEKKKKAQESSRLE